MPCAWSVCDGDRRLVLPARESKAIINCRNRYLKVGGISVRCKSLKDRALILKLFTIVSADALLTQGGCGQNLGLPEGSSCTHTKTAFAPSSFI